MNTADFRIFPLTRPKDRSEYSYVAAQSATGLGSLNTSGAIAPINRCLALFCCPTLSWAHACQFYGGRCVEGFGPAGSVCPVCQPAPSATLLGSKWADSRPQTESDMSYDTQEAPASAARQVAHYFSLIANTLEWNHAAWLSLMACLEGTGKATHALTLADVAAAIAAVDALLSEAQR